MALSDCLQEKRVLEEDAKKLKGFKAYNILPLKAPLGAPSLLNPFDFFPEVRFTDLYARIC